MLLSILKSVFIFFLSILISIDSIYSQTPPAIQWQNTIGGNAYDFLWACNPTSDGGAILGGWSNSGLSGDKTENTVTFHDMWIVKIDANGNVMWDETIGGSGDDEAYDVNQTSDGGYIVAGWSGSGISGDKTDALFGVHDYWILKLDNDGDIIWQKTFGGSLMDEAQQVRETPDGGFLVAGWSNSAISGNKTETNYGGTMSDYWIIKLDAAGNLIWQNDIGGNNYDVLYSMDLTNDGGCIVGGYSESTISGEKTETCYGEADFWVVKLNSSGNIEWQNTIGGNKTDFLLNVKQTIEGGYILGGYSYTDINGDKTETSYSTSCDFWIVKLNSAGNISWQNSVGGNQDDYCFSVDQTTDLGFVAAGVSYSGATGDKNEVSQGNGDVWVIKLDNQGTLKWQNGFGGAQIESARSIFQSPADSSFIVGCLSESGSGGDKTEGNMGFIGSWDFWPVKLFRDCYPTAEICNNLDDNCNGLKDDGLIFLDYYTDADADGYGNIASTPVNSCQAIPGKVTDHTDCNDANASIHPGSEEICNGIDDNCNAINDDGLIFITYYSDMDADGYGNIADDGDSSCTIIAGSSANNSDCNDGNNLIHPDATEICNELDDDCNGIADDGLTFIDYYIDGDADGFGSNSDTGVSSCSFLAGTVANNNDCNDESNLIYPGAMEICNGIDDDCDASVDEGIILTITISAAGATTVCQGGSVVLTAIYSGATLQWKKNGAVIPGATSANYSATKSGNYTCVTTNACGSATSNAINITINKNPNASISAGGATTFCAGGSVTLTEVAVAGCTYQWYKGASLIAGATSTNYIATTAGNYKCRVTKTATGCYKNSNIISVTVPCREGEITNNPITIYPNPNNGTFEIIIPNPASASPFEGGLRGMNIQVYNSLGQLIHSEELISSTQIISLGNISSGIYFVRVGDGNNYAELKLIIE